MSTCCSKSPIGCRSISAVSSWRFWGGAFRVSSQGRESPKRSWSTTSARIEEGAVEGADEKNMSLIEHLEQDDWREFLRNSFEHALDVLKNDRFRAVGSSVDDLRSWLTDGGIPRIKERLNDQMDIRCFSAERKAAVNTFLEHLVGNNRAELLALMAAGIVSSTKQEWLDACGISETQFQELLSRILAGERPFEDWMHSHGRSDEEIAAIYSLIDRWLMQRGLIPMPSGPSVH